MTDIITPATDENDGVVKEENDDLKKDINLVKDYHPTYNTTSTRRNSVPLFKPTNLTQELDAENLHYLMSLLQLSPNIIYPTIYVSPAGLLTVLLKNDIAIEMTSDKTIRLVNHRYKATASINGSGTAASLFHPICKAYQENGRLDLLMFWDRKARLDTKLNLLQFSIGDTCYTMENNRLLISPPQFKDITKDMTISLLFSSRGYGPSLLPRYEEMANKANYRMYKNGALSICIENVRIYQTAMGDVTVNCWPKIIKTSPITGAMYLQCPACCLAINDKCMVDVRDAGGVHRIRASVDEFTIADGLWECRFSSLSPIMGSAAWNAAGFMNFGGNRCTKTYGGGGAGISICENSNDDRRFAGGGGITSSNHSNYNKSSDSCSFSKNYNKYYCYKNNDNINNFDNCPEGGDNYGVDCCSSNNWNSKVNEIENVKSSTLEMKINNTTPKSNPNISGGNGGGGCGNIITDSNKDTTIKRNSNHNEFAGEDRKRGSGHDNHHNYHTNRYIHRHYNETVSSSNYHQSYNKFHNQERFNNRRFVRRGGGRGGYAFMGGIGGNRQNRFTKTSIDKTSKRKEKVEENDMEKDKVVEKEEKLKRMPFKQGGDLKENTVDTKNKDKEDSVLGSGEERKKKFVNKLDDFKGHFNKKFIHDKVVVVNKNNSPIRRRVASNNNNNRIYKGKKENVSKFNKNFKASRYHDDNDNDNFVDYDNCDGSASMGNGKKPIPVGTKHNNNRKKYTVHKKEETNCNNNNDKSDDNSNNNRKNNDTFISNDKKLTNNKKKNNISDSNITNNTNTNNSNCKTATKTSNNNSELIIDSGTINIFNKDEKLGNDNDDDDEYAKNTESNKKAILKEAPIFGNKKMEEKQVSSLSSSSPKSVFSCVKKTTVGIKLSDRQMTKYRDVDKLKRLSNGGGGGVGVGSKNIGGGGCKLFKEEALLTKPTFSGGCGSGGVRLFKDGCSVKGGGGVSAIGSKLETLTEVVEVDQV